MTPCCSYHQKILFFITKLFTSIPLKHTFFNQVAEARFLQHTLQHQHPESLRTEILNGKWEATVSRKLSTLSEKTSCRYLCTGNLKETERQTCLGPEWRNDRELQRKRKPQHLCFSCCDPIGFSV